MAFTAATLNVQEYFPLIPVDIAFTGTAAYA